MRLLSYLLMLLLLAGCFGSSETPNPQNANAFLSNLSFSTGDFDQPFNRDVRGYSTTVPYSVSSLQITPTLEDADATVEINGQATAADQPSAPVALAVGENLIIVQVIAQDGSTRLSYTVTVVREASENAFLSGIALSSGQINENFLAGQYTYTANVAANVDSLRLTPTAEDPTATIVVNGLTFGSGEQSQPIPLFKGSNLISAVVNAQNGYTRRVYSLMVERGSDWGAPLSASASLSALSLSSGALDQPFDSLQRLYTQTVDNSVFQLQVLATAADIGGWITVNGVDAVSGQPSSYVNLALGENIINVVVKSEDGFSQKTYTIIVNRLARSNALLADLLLSSGTLSPAFSVGVDQLNATVDNSVSSISVTPVAQDISARVWVAQAPQTDPNVSPTMLEVPYGQSSQPIALVVGSNKIPVLAKAEDGSTSRVFTLNVARQGNSVVTLSGLSLSSGTLSPAFAAGTRNYTATVANGVSSINLTATTTDGSNVLTVNGASASSGAAYSVALSVGKNDLLVELQSSDGKTKNQYRLTITRDGTSVPDLLDLGVVQSGVVAKPSYAGAVGSVNLLSGFSTGTTIYNIRVAYETSSIQIAPVAQDAGATITVNGTPVTSGQTSPSIPLTSGANTAINVVVTSSDGLSSKNYLIAVFREGNNNAEMASMTLAGMSYSPGFHPGTTEYSVNASWNATSVTITPVLADSNASVKIKGVISPSGSPYAVSLLQGTNLIPLEVTAQNLSTTRIYNLTVNVDYGINSDLSRLGLSVGTLSPVFDPAVLSYTASVANEVSTINVVPETAAIGATVQVNGVAVSSGAVSGAIPLAVGANAISVRVASASGSVISTYTVNVTREASSDASLVDLQVSTGTLSPLFISDIASYTLNVSNDAPSVLVNPVVSTAGATTTITANGQPVVIGSTGADVPLNVGVNNITVLVTAPNGTTQRAYSIVASRSASNNAKLLGLVLPANTGNLSPAFSGDIFVYTVSVPYSVNSLSLAPYAGSAASTIRVNGLFVPSGTYSPAKALQVGNNVFEIEVIAEDEVSKVSYLVTVDRQKDYGVIYLTNLVPSTGSLVPAFDSGITTYALEVHNSVTEFYVTPITNITTAGITVNGGTTASGSASRVFSLNVGENTISTVVYLTADQKKFKTYNIFVTRRANDNADIASLGVTNVKLQPSFNKNITSYTQTVPNHVASVNVTAVLDDYRSTLMLNGAVATSGTPVVVNLLAGSNNVITATGTAENGNQKSYVLNITRKPQPASNNADLFDMEPLSGALDSAFSAAQTTYNMSVGYLVSSVRFQSILEDINATLRVNGSVVASGEPSQSVALQEGNNQVQLQVTARDGVTVKLYTVNITRQSGAEFAAHAHQYVKASNTNAGDWFGSGVAVSGNTMVVGARYEDGSYSSDGIVGSKDNNGLSNSGVIYVFERDTLGNWSQVAYLKPAVIDPDDNFGYDVAIDGDTIVVGAPGDDTSWTGVNPAIDVNGYRNSGAAYVFVRDSGVWRLHSKLKSGHNDMSQSFGVSVAIHKDTVIVGAIGDDSSSKVIINGETAASDQGATDAGAATVFVRDVKGDWTQQAYLKASNAGGGDHFGNAVAVYGDTAVVGAPYEDTTGGDAGAAYVYVRDANGLWSEQQMLKASNAGGGDRMGAVVAIHGDTIIAGATKEDTGGTDAGAAYVFVRNAGVWSEEAMLKASNVESYDQFGMGVDIDGDTIVVGALTEDGASKGVTIGGTANNGYTYSGAVYVFTRSAGVWAQNAYVKATNAGASDNFGQYLSVEGGTLVVGGYLEDSNSTGINGVDNNLAKDSGAVYIYR